ncbi:uncharacterized protein LOC119993665 isoform X2 [Tripterygium wilfordii]|uniref:uncharacterized protein LOC119993665 isoform X2 n=1 Tax=Tripterygium wilfordii TaxID=458696 RepID=UPI0018F7FD65|nr:uncharacterized protein LOC119993665 isoform X2 [Tripterygium wilfordii]
MMSSSSTSLHPALLGSFATLFWFLDSTFSFKFSAPSSVRFLAAPLHARCQSFTGNESSPIMNQVHVCGASFEEKESASLSTLPFLSYFHESMEAIVAEVAEGMNGSITYELGRPENAGLRKPLKECSYSWIEWRLLMCKKFASISILANLIAVAGAEAVSVCGDPTIPVQLSRLDSIITLTCSCCYVK